MLTGSAIFDFCFAATNHHLTFWGAVIDPRHPVPVGSREINQSMLALVIRGQASESVLGAFRPVAMIALKRAIGGDCGRRNKTITVRATWARLLFDALDAVSGLVEGMVFRPRDECWEMRRSSSTHTAPAHTTTCCLVTKVPQGPQLGLVTLLIGDHTFSLPAIHDH